MIAIDLPWPPRVLHPNSRVHWTRRAVAARVARQTGAYCTLAAGIRLKDPDIPQSLKVTAIFSPPDGRRRDLDGMLSSVKNYLDGIADVIGIDDSRWQIALRKEAPRKGGSVRIELEAQ
ncbi:endodeoxyribonuclease RusA [Mesorhizobium sp. B2-1-3]|uniref:endodeoxyribonuclease RusA n=1 Tax=Mesorhizobium sp. B2-1-3 TaxID=2589972 RepID=UPI0011278849|nr:endodeoxyribonuclease RusA [Mesorhizobium sp. B2-1-3]TPN03826.1 endodeoxyribonuclease RusA [Mesorhizobium sp. B2-1-3]